MSVTYWLMDAFTDSVFGGNVAGVVPDAAGLNEDQMQAIAGELGASETAFVVPPTEGVEADFRLRYFTPTCEVDLCGHATIGSVCGLVEDSALIPPGQHGVVHVQTNVGVLPISWQRSPSVQAEMRQAEPRYRDEDVNLDVLARYLGIEVADFDHELPLGLAYTGLWDLFVPVRSLEVMSKLQPDGANLAALNHRLQVASTHVYTRETAEQQHDFHARDFSPALGIPEDPATGTATGALLALLCKHGVTEAGHSYAFEQGYEIGRKSVVRARMEQRERDVSVVYVRGRAVCSARGTLQL